MSVASVICREGNTSLVVPPFDEPRMIPAFFNQRARFVRDISITCYRAYCEQNSGSEVAFADSLSGTGARGIRVANEVPQVERVFLNDINSRALEFAEKSAKLNRVEDRCFFSRSEVCSFLGSRVQNSEERFDIVDVDPFGTPSDFVDCAIRAVKDSGMLSLTATDSAVLCGVYPRVALRKYLGLPLRTEYSHEIGIRLMLGLAAQTAMRLETGIVPVFSHHDMHYFRVYLSIKVGNSYSRENEKKIGFIAHCFNCGHRSTVSRDVFFSLNDEPGGVKKGTSLRQSGSKVLICPSCGRGGAKEGGRIAIGGPLWIGQIHSKEFVSECREISDRPIFNEELDLPLYYNLKSIRLRKGTSMPKINDVVTELRSQGYLASRTRMNPNALRTNAMMEALQNIVLELAH